MIRFYQAHWVHWHEVEVYQRKKHAGSEKFDLSHDGLVGRKENTSIPNVNIIVKCWRGLVPLTMMGDLDFNKNSRRIRISYNKEMRKMVVTRRRKVGWMNKQPLVTRWRQLSCGSLTRFEASTRLINFSRL